MFRRRYLLCLLLIAAWLAPGRAGSAQEAPSYPDWRFGVVEAYETPAQADALGAAWTRITFHWAEIQAGGPDSWTPRVGDDQIEAQVAAGREVVGLLIGIPDWARDDKGLPRGLWLDDDDPQNLWARYVRRLVEQYAGQVDHWIIWNEPDIWDSAAPGHTWDGDVADFAQLQKVAYRVAREANAQSVIHLPAFTYYWDVNGGREQYMARLLDELAADEQAGAYHHYFDVATAHLYFQPGQVYDVLQAFRQILEEHGLHKPLWLVETNAPPSSDPSWPVADVTLRVTLGEQAAYMPQAVALALAAGAERISVYKLQDLDSDAAANPEPFGLIRRDGSRRPAFTTYQLASRYLAGALGAERQRWDEVGQIVVNQRRFTTTVLFSRLPTAQEARVAAQAPQALLADMWGSQRLLTADDGYFTVPLPPALCTQPIGDYCMIGGTTYYLIQPVAGETLPQRLPAPDLSPTEPPPPTPITPTPTVPTATPTPSPTATLTPTASPSPTPTATDTPEPQVADSPSTSSPLPGAISLPQPTGAYVLAGAALLLAAVIIAIVRRRS